MKYVKGVIVAIMLMAVSLTFFACDSNLPDLSCSGNITINSVALEGVTIKSNIKNYTQTNKSGEYSFTTNAESITIYPEKSGYIFTPKSVTITAGENLDINFVAEEIVEIDGTLKLNKVIISPTVIVNSPENYEYVNSSNGKKGVKAKDIYLWQNNSILVTDQTNYLYKNTQNNIDISSNITFDCGQKFSLGILINMYFMPRNHQESSTSEQDSKSNYSFLYVENAQTNADLINNQIVYNLYGINNHLRTVTYNVSFVFDYIK